MRKPVSVLVTSIAASVAAVLGGAAVAEDIDIYSKSSDGTVRRENVLIILDNSANWSASIADSGCLISNRASGVNEVGTKMGMEKCALYEVVESLGDTALNVGLMLFNESPAANSGGYPRVRIFPMNEEAHTSEFLTAVRDLHVTSDKGNNAAFSKTLHEAYLYMNQLPPYRGTLGTKEDERAFMGGAYTLPGGTPCATHVIFIANGGPGEVTDNDAESLLQTLMTGAGAGRLSQIKYAAGEVTKSDQGNWADEYARFMRQHSQTPIVVHGIAVTGASSDGLYPNFIAKIAFEGGGEYHNVDSAAELADAIKGILGRVKSSNSVFASASLPISVNARGTYLNQVFMGMFLPDELARPRWAGNLKQYQFQFNFDTKSLYLADADGDPAIASTGGFIDADAESFWTQSSTFWANAPDLDPDSLTPASDLPDGKIVPKGGAAQRLRTDNLTSQTGREVFTCISCARNTLLGSSLGTNFASTNTSINLGVSALEQPLLIDWIRGTDNVPDDPLTGNSDEPGPGGLVSVRPYLHGDVLHSRPAVVNYGESGGIVLFYGANDGMLHAVQGDQTGTAAGKHLWSFVPEEHFGKLRRLRENSPRINFPGLLTTDTEPTPTGRDYFVDGPISVYQKVDEAGVIQKVYLYVGMRRGGRFLYAFDVTAPDAPRFLWKVTNDSTGMSDLGQTWSEARIARVKGYVKDGVETPVIIMGGGYDPAEDLAPVGETTMGNRIFVLDAFTGEHIRSFETVRPVTADVSVVDSDYDGYVDRAYTVDLGGHVYRMDFEISTEAGLLTGDADWTSTQIARISPDDLSETTTDGASDGQKFFYAPDVVLTKGYAVLLFGSGDREKPLMDFSQDYFYTLTDREIGKGVSDSYSPISIRDLRAWTEYATHPEARGCYLKFNYAGEKVVNAPLTIGGMTYFGTNRPTPVADENACTTLGEARTYQVPLVCGAPTSVKLEGGGLPPSPVAGTVQITYRNTTTGEDETRLFPFIIGGINPKASPIEGSEVKLTIPPTRKKIYWHTETER